MRPQQAHFELYTSGRLQVRTIPAKQKPEEPKPAKDALDRRARRLRRLGLTIREISEITGEPRATIGRRIKGVKR